MRTSPVVFLLLAAGCATPAPAALATPAPPAPPPRPAAVTCGDAGVLLRGTVEDQRQAGPAKEAAIASTCRTEQWPAELLACVGEQPQAQPCLDKLTAAQRTAYDQALVAWNEAYPDEMLEEGYDEGDDDGGMSTYVDCGDAIQDVSGFAPAVTLTGDSRDYLLELRRHALVELCEDDWENDKRACFRDLAAGGVASNTTAVGACRAQLDPAQARAVTDKLAELDKLGAKVAALAKHPASHDCKKVVAAHYGDAAWKGKLDGIKGAERTKVVAESRTRMLTACNGDRWPPNLRACIVAGGAGACFTAVSSSSWGFPAFGVHVKSGIAECDAYAATMKAVDACAALSQEQRDANRRSWSYLHTTWASVPPERKAATAQACKQVDDAVRRAVTSAGCKI